MRHSSRSGEEGFSLLEVMAAVAVLAAAVAALLQLSAGGLRLARGVQDRTALVMAADASLMADGKCFIRWQCRVRDSIIPIQE